MYQRPWFHFLIAALSGLVLSLACPRWSLEPAVWLWMLPLLALLWLLHFTKRKLFALGYVAGLAYFVPSLSWIRQSSRVINGATGDEWMGWGVELMGWGAVAAMCLYLSLYTGAWALFTARVARPRAAILRHGNWLDASLDSLRSAFLSASAWVALEWIRTWLFTGFGWNGLGVALYQNKVLIQAADLIGVTGLSFLPVFSSCIAFNVVHRLVLRVRTGGGFRYHFDAIVTLAMVCAQVVYGITHLNAVKPESVPVRVALVQLNIPQVDVFTGDNLQAHYNRYAELTQLYTKPAPGATTSPVDLVVWPESALGLPFEHKDHEPFFKPLLEAGDFSLLTGGDTSDDKGSYGCAALVHKEWGAAQLYRKVHLVPFGEYLPLRNTVPFLNATLGQVLPSDFTPGDKTDPLQLANPQIQIIPLICFEDTDGNLARKFVRNAPQLLVNLTNDGWFLRSAENEQHLANAIFRTIELRRPMCRSANSGVTCFIDDCGRVTSSLRDAQTGSPFIEGVLPATLQLNAHPPLTLYARWGDWFAVVCFGIALVSLLRAVKRQTDTKSPV